MKKINLTISLTIVIVMSILLLTACGVPHGNSYYNDWEDLRGVYGDESNQDEFDNTQPNNPDQNQDEFDDTQPNNPGQNQDEFDDTQPNNPDQNQDNNDISQPDSSEENQNTQPQPEQSIQKSKDVLLMSTISSLNIRSGPSTSNAVVGSLPKGAMVPLINTINSEWHETTYKNKAAYISTSFTQKVEFEKGETAVEKVIDQGKKLLGFPYVWGAERYHWGPPNAHKNHNFVMGEFDCSSLTQYAYYKGADVVLDLTTRTQIHQGASVPRENLSRGDLMFFTNSSRRHLSGNERVGHVAIYLGDNYILHTASTYAIIEPISSLRWSYYITSKRVI
ncbi:MAG: C40 family peptidase [Bacillota bacterium]